MQKLRSDPAYGYVNQRAFKAGARESSRWRTIMSSNTQCDDDGFDCNRLLLFSNPRQQHDGDPLGIPRQPGEAGVDGPVDAVAVLNATGPAVALWRDPPGPNSPPEPVGTLTLVVNGDVVAGTVRTPEATYRIRPAGNGLHAVSQVDLSQLPPLGEPIPGRRPGDQEPPFELDPDRPPAPR